MKEVGKGGRGRGRGGRGEGKGEGEGEGGREGRTEGNNIKRKRKENSVVEDHCYIRTQGSRCGRGFLMVKNVSQFVVFFSQKFKQVYCNTETIYSATAHQYKQKLKVHVHRTISKTTKK